MVAMLWVSEIIHENRKFKEVPPTLKPAVKKLLTNAGCEHLITEE